MKRIFKLVEKYFFIIILNVINVLLGVILFGMGTTLKIENFVNVFKRPKEILLGVSAQYLLMPLIAFAIASKGLFLLEQFLEEQHLM